MIVVEDEVPHDLRNWPDCAKEGHHVSRIMLSDPIVRACLPMRSVDMIVGIAPIKRHVVITTIEDENVPVTDVTRRALVAYGAEMRRALSPRHRYFQETARFFCQGDSLAAWDLAMPRRAETAIALVTETADHFQAIGRPGIARALLKQARATWA